MFNFMNLLLTQTILFIGDSHTVGPFGQHLDEVLRSNGARVATYGSCGSIPKWWSNGQRTTCGYFSKDLNGRVFNSNTYATPKINELLDKIRPDVVLLEFGGNYSKISDDQIVIQDIKKIVKTVKDSGARCYWVTAPDSRTLREARHRTLKLTIEAIGLDCPIFNSLTVTHYPQTGGDGIHYSFPSAIPIAKKWADSVASEFIRTFSSSDF